MKVIKVIVDELPKGCKWCVYGNYEYGKCDITRKRNYIIGEKEDDLYSYRPPWCPLVTEEEYNSSYADLASTCLKLYQNTQKIEAGDK